MVDQRRFGTLTFDAMHQFENKQRQQAQAGMNTLVLPEGFTFFRLPKEKDFVKIDIIPFVAVTENGPQPLARYNYHIHRNIGPGFVSVVCPQNQKGLPCPVCDYVRKLNWNDPADMELRKKYRPQTRQLYAVVQVDGPPETKDKIMIFDTSEYGFGRLLDEKITKRDVTDKQEAGWDKYADLLEGWTLKLNLCEQSFGGPQTYTAVSSIDFKARSQQYSEEWYDKVPDLSSCVVLLDYDAIKEKFEGQSAEPTQGENQDAQAAQAVASYDPTAGYNPMVAPVVVENPVLMGGVAADVSDDNPF